MNIIKCLLVCAMFSSCSTFTTALKIEHEIEAATEAAKAISEGSSNDNK